MLCSFWFEANACAYDRLAKQESESVEPRPWMITWARACSVQWRRGAIRVRTRELKKGADDDS